MHWPFQTLGNPAYPPICFLHGFLGEGNDWLRIVKEWAGRYFYILPDLPGHGANTKLPFENPLTFEQLNEGLITLLDSLDIQKTHLVGYSMGGRAALFFAVHHPDRVASLILESVGPGLTDPNERRARASEDDARAEAILVGGVETFVEHWYTLPLFHSLQAQPRVRAQIIARRKADNPAWMAKVIRELSPGRQPPVWDQLSRLDMPVLLIVGALDKKYVMLGEDMAARMSNAQLVVIPEAGHTIHLEKPDNFVSLLRDFLNEVGTISHL